MTPDNVRDGGEAESTQGEQLRSLEWMKREMTAAWHDATYG